MTRAPKVVKRSSQPHCSERIRITSVHGDRKLSLTLPFKYRRAIVERATTVGTIEQITYIIVRSKSRSNETEPMYLEMLVPENLNREGNAAWGMEERRALPVANYTGEFLSFEVR
jgi:hypothetical protein